MGDGDVFAKLSRILETHTLKSEDGESAQSMEDVLHKISLEAGTRIEDMIGDATGKKKKKERAAESGYYERPTPYEVWEAKQSEKFSTAEKQTKVLSEQQWDRLVEHLHRTNKMKESALMKEQNQGLALELNGLSFKPHMNNHSLSLASTMKSLQHRLDGMVAKREANLQKRREEQAEAQLAECTFTPNRAGAAKSEAYLKRMGRGPVTPDLFFKYHEEKLRRNEKRKQIIDEINSRELTFSPQVNAKSKKIQEKLIQKNVLKVDPVSRQTVEVRRSYADSTSEDTTVQKSGHPSISLRARAYKGTSSGVFEGKSVHERLYEQAVEQNMEHHNRQIEIMSSKLNLKLKPWEATPMSKHISNAWTQIKTHHAKLNKGFDHLVDDVNKPVSVIEFDDSLGNIWKTLRTSMPLEGFNAKGGNFDQMYETEL